MMEKHRFSIELGQRGPRHERSRSENGPTTVIVMGDFSGQTRSEGAQVQTDYRLMRVVQETLDTLCERIGPTLLSQTGLESQPQTIKFRCLEDFHPDSICTQLHILDPGTLVSSSANTANEDQRGQESPPPHAPPESAQDIVKRLLGKRSLGIERQRAGKEGSSSVRQSLIQDVVQRLADQADTPATIAPVGTMINVASATSTLRAVLHAPGFQALEATWRSLDWLLRTVETDDETTFYILDISYNSLIEEIGEGENVENSNLYHALQEQLASTIDERSDLLLIGDFYFGIGPEDIRLLDGLGQLVSSFGGRLFAGAESDTFEQPPDPALARGWEQFRQTPVSQYILLALPRILLRRPYGKTIDPIDTFVFEELKGHEPGRLLWGNPAFACAIVILQQMQEILAEPLSTIADMPAYSYRLHGESQLQPGTEKLYSEHQIDHLLSLGLTPILGSRHSNVIHAPWLQTLAIAA